MKTIYGAYTHARPNGSVFHVGKGPRGRSICRLNRNKDHKRIADEYGWENIVIRFYKCSSEAAALKRESTMIKNYRKQGIKLTNRTTGGQGISGHKHSDKSRRKMSSLIHWESKSKSSRENMQNPLTREKIRASLKGRKRPKEVVEKIRLGVKRAWKDPKKKKKYLKASKKLWRNKKYKRKMIKILRTVRKTVKWRKNMSASQRERYKKNKHLRTLASRRHKKLWQDSKYRKRVIIAQNKGRAKPSYRKKRKEIATKLWQDEKFRKKISAGHKRYHVNKDRR